MANRAPSASASSGAWPKSSQRAPPTNTRARRSAARNSPAGRLPGNSAFAGSGVAVRSRWASAASRSTPNTTSRAWRISAAAQAAHTMSSPFAFTSGV